jgi:hypothetical protein
MVVVNLFIGGGKMFNFIIGSIVGFCIATYGITGVAESVDTILTKVKQVQITTGK